MKDFPLFRSPRAAVAGTLLTALPLLILSGSMLSGMYAAVLVLFLLPAALCITAAVCGLLPMVLGAAAGLIAMGRLFGQQGMMLAAVYVLPILTAFLLVVSLRVPFRQACPALIGVHVAVLAGCYLILQGWTGGSLYTAAGEKAAQALKNWELGDNMLYQLYSMGLIGLPETLQGTALTPVLGGYTLSEAAREDLLLSLTTLVTRSLALLIPNVIVTQSILGGVACLLLPLRFGYIAQERRAYLSSSVEDGGVEGPAPVDFPDLGMPRFETWHLPRGIGWQVGLALAAGYLLRNSVNPAVSVAGIILYSVGHAVFSIQGAAMVYFMQKLRGTKRIWRIIVISALFLFSVLVFIGIFDQINNIRGLRKPREPKEGI